MSHPILENRPTVGTVSASGLRRNPDSDVGRKEIVVGLVMA
jgi:hypothetical protein